MRGQLELVFVVNDARAQLRIVKTGKRIAGEVEIIAGLSAGEKIATTDVATLVDGQPVEVK